MHTITTPPRTPSATPSHVARESADASRASRYLIPVLAGAAALRLYWALAHTFVIESEGAEYASIARNLLEGNGYVGSLEGGAQLLFPPLYPILIAMFSLVTGDFETAGRLVSVTFGTLLVLPTYFIALRIYSRRVALIAAVLTACYPLWLGLSASVYSEAPFLTFALAGVFWSLRSLSLERMKDGALAGTCFGLAYLTRPEALAYPALSVVTILLASRLDTQPIRRTVLASVAVLASFLCVAAPYILFLSLQTGQFRIEGKGALNYTMAARMNAGMSYSEASYGIGDDLQEQGPVLNVNKFIRSSSSVDIGLGQSLRNLLASAKRNVRPLQSALLSRAFGSVILAALIVLGLFGRPWTRQRATSEILLLAFSGFSVVLLLSMNGLQWRYAFPLVSFLIPWAAKGIDETAAWTRTIGERVHRLPPQGLTFASNSVRVMAIACFVGVSATGVNDLAEFEWSFSNHLPVKQAGLWLERHRPGPKQIMDVEAVIPYYSNGTLLCLPHAESSVSLRYIAHKAPDFIVLKGGEIGWRPYIEDWIKNGIPDQRAQLVYQTGETLKDRVLIYQWQPSRRTDASGPSRQAANDSVATSNQSLEGVTR